MRFIFIFTCVRKVMIVKAIVISCIFLVSSSSSSATSTTSCSKIPKRTWPCLATSLLLLEENRIIMETISELAMNQYLSKELR